MNETLNLVWCFTHLSVRPQAAAAGYFSSMIFSLKYLRNNHTSNINFKNYVWNMSGKVVSLNSHRLNDKPTFELDATHYDLLINSWISRFLQNNVKGLYEINVLQNLEGISSKLDQTKTVYILNASFWSPSLYGHLPSQSNAIFLTMGRSSWKDQLEIAETNIHFMMHEIDASSNEVAFKLTKERVSNISFGASIYPHFFGGIINSKDHNTENRKSIISQKFSSLKFDSLRLLTGGKNILDRLTEEEIEKVIVPVLLLDRVKTWTFIGCKQDELNSLISRFIKDSILKDKCM